MKINYCGKCGAELWTGSNFCTSCGWKLPDEAQMKIIESMNQVRQSNTEVSVVTPSTSLESNDIGASSDERKCINCKNTLPENAEFCTQCGLKQKEVASISEKWCIYCGKVMSVNDMFCAKCGANQNPNVQQQYYAQANHNSNAPRQGYAQTVPVLNTTKKNPMVALSQYWL